MNSANASVLSPPNLSPDSGSAKSLQQMQMKATLSSQKPIETTNKSMEAINFESSARHCTESDV